jgi:hypothetical protein
MIEQNDFQQFFGIATASRSSFALIGQFEDDVSESDMMDALHNIRLQARPLFGFGVDSSYLGGKISVYASGTGRSPVCPAS